MASSPAADVRAIPVASPTLAYERHRAAVDDAVAKVLASGRYVLGPEVEAFEREFADYLGVAHACGVASGTDAVELALRASGVGSGDLVLTVSHTAVASLVGIERTGARPVLVDVGARSYTMDTAQMGAAVEDLAGREAFDSPPRLKAILVVHLYGSPVDMGPVLDVAARYGLEVVEDCAQAHGAQWQGRMVGSMGRAGAFSFYPTKNLGGFGDGGMVVTGDDVVARRVRALRQYGWEERYVSRCRGVNSRLDEVQAAALRVRLPFLDEENDRRREIATAYGDGLAATGLDLPSQPEGSRHVYHQYVVRTTERDSLRAALASEGIATAVLYPVPVHRQEAYSADVMTWGSLGVTETICSEILSLPMGSHLTGEDVSCVTSAIRSWAGA